MHINSIAFFFEMLNLPFVPILWGTRLRALSIIVLFYEVYFQFDAVKFLIGSFDERDSPFQQGVGEFLNLNERFRFALNGFHQSVVLFQMRTCVDNNYANLLSEEEYIERVPFSFWSWARSVFISFNSLDKISMRFSSSTDLDWSGS